MVAVLPQNWSPQAPHDLLFFVSELKREAFSSLERSFGGRPRGQMGRKGEKERREREWGAWDKTGAEKEGRKKDQVKSAEKAIEKKKRRRRRRERRGKRRRGGGFWRGFAMFPYVSFTRLSSRFFSLMSTSWRSLLSPSF